MAPYSSAVEIKVSRGPEISNLKVLSTYFGMIALLAQTGLSRDLKLTWTLSSTLTTKCTIILLQKSDEF